MACAAALSEAGVRAQGVAGFSLGELAALAYSGIVSEEQAFSLVCQRARLMDRCGDTQKGAMAAVLKLNNRTVEGLCREAGVFPVNYNCEGQLVAAGTENGIQKLIELCAKVGGKALRLPVSGAFHSPLMRDAARGLTRALRELTFKSPVMPIYANATAEPYGSDPADLLAQQVISPVLWQQTIENMVQNGYDTFVEAGRAGRCPLW
jgi:[acyl-carrier-protein] S-malonyltransferase